MERLRRFKASFSSHGFHRHGGTESGSEIRDPQGNQNQGPSASPIPIDTPTVEQTVAKASTVFPFASDFVLNQPSFISDSRSYNTTNVYRGNHDQLEGFAILKSHTASSALHNSQARSDAPKCDEDTRVELIAEIMDWIQDWTTPTSLLCMTGPAGSGKSALQQTIAQLCYRRHILAASFFFSSTDNLRNNVSRLIATIAYQIAQNIPSTRACIAAAVEDDPLIFDRQLEAQVDALIVNPLQLASQTPSEQQTSIVPYAIIIDGLDECKGESQQEGVLRVLHSYFILRKLPFRICISGRPEFAIRAALGSDGYLHKFTYHIELSHFDASADIYRYLSRRLKELGRKHARTDPRASPISWPVPTEIDTLVASSSGQFIYAATVVKFLSEPRCSPVDRLKMVTSWQPGASQREKPFADLDALYTGILNVAQEAYQPLTDDSLSIVRLLHQIILYMENFGRKDLRYVEQILKMTPGHISRSFIDLHSLLKFGDDDKPWVAFHHKSFIDFLQDPTRAKDLYLPSSVVWAELIRFWLDAFQRAPESDIIAQLCSLQMTIREPVRFILLQWCSFLRPSKTSDEVVVVFDEFNDQGGWDKLLRCCQKAMTQDFQSSSLFISQWFVRLDMFKNGMKSKSDLPLRSRMSRPMIKMEELITSLLYG